MPWDPATSTYTPDPELFQALRGVHDKVKKLADFERMQEYQGHPIPGIPGRRFLGKEPSCYSALRALRDAGRMPQAEFMQVYVKYGGARLRNGRTGSFLNNFDRFVWNRRDSLADPSVRLNCLMSNKGMTREKALRHITYETINHRMKVIKVIRSKYEDTGRTRTVKTRWNTYQQPVKRCVEPSGAPYNGNMLEWYIQADVPDWRPEYMIPEDLYAL